jgi:hypothetical protein
MDDEDNNHVLDLDEALGQRMKVKVRRNGIEYSFVDLYALGAHKVIQIQSMRQKVARLQIMSEISEKQAEEIEKLFDDILMMLCADFPIKDITYMEKTTVLTFYFTEIQQKKVVSPNKK